MNRLSYSDIERIERRQQAWEDRPPSTWGDVRLRMEQQDEDIKALIAEYRAQQNDYSILFARTRQAEAAAESRNRGRFGR